MSEPDVLTTVEWYRSAKHLYTTKKELAEAIMCGLEVRQEGGDK